MTVSPETTPSTAPFWEGAARSRLLLPFCRDCNQWLHPQDVCWRHGPVAREWREASGRGTLVAFVNCLDRDGASTITLIKLDEGPQLVSCLARPRNLTCGMKMEAHFTRLDSNVGLVVFDVIGP